MATASFYKEMKFDKEESKRLLKFIEHESKKKIKHKIKMPDVQEAPNEFLDKVFAKCK